MRLSILACADADVDLNARAEIVTSLALEPVRVPVPEDMAYVPAGSTTEAVLTLLAWTAPFASIISAR